MSLLFRTILPMALLGYGMARALRANPRRRIAFARPEDGGPAGGFARVRDAGPDQMRDPDKNWDELDEALDETFPTSDPVARY